jgi:hypothetical protein
LALTFDTPVGYLWDAIRELKSTRSEFQRLKAIETGTNALRDPVEHPWLHWRAQLSLPTVGKLNQS